MKDSKNVVICAKRYKNLAGFIPYLKTGTNSYAFCVEDEVECDAIYHLLDLVTNYDIASSQDMFYNYEMCKYVLQQSKNVKVCILEMSPYALWYDMFLSLETERRSIYYLSQTNTCHHLKDGERYLLTDILNTELERF